MRFRLRTLLIVFLFGPPIVVGLAQSARFVRAKQLEAASRNNGMVYPGRQERVFIGR
jgi:hypothetical protein